MENYFQAEAFNLDKVLDEFEQNEADETDTPTLSDAKWTQILAPPAHLLSLNPALAHPDFSPREPPLNFKPFPESPGETEKESGNGSEWDGPPEGRAEVRSPLSPQPNIGKLVSGDGPAPAASEERGVPRGDCGSVPSPSMENGCPSSPDFNGCAELPPDDDGTRREVLLPNQRGVPPDLPDAPQGGSGGSADEVTSACKESPSGVGEDQGRGVLSVEDCALSEPPEHSSIIGSPKGERNLEVPRGSPGEGGAEMAPPLCGPEPAAAADAKAHPERISNGSVTGPREATRPLANGGLTGPGQETRAGPGAGQTQEAEGSQGDTGLTDPSDRGSPHPEDSLHNGLDVEESGGAGVCRPSQNPPSKEDSVTEEKEMEESKQESYEQARGADGPSHKLNNSSLQPVSVPYGGARPKQPVTLKLQIPRPLSGQVQNELGAYGKNKNLEAQSRAGGDAYAEDAGGATVNGDGDAGALLAPSGLQLPSESPDNDLQAGHMGVLSKRPPSTLGEVAPVWVPDSQAPVCMKCEVKFTFTKRRHHCRACGKVFCAACCSLKSRLMYMDRKEARVCITCHSALMNAQSWENMVSGCNQSPNPNNPAEYCSTIPPLQQAQASGALSSPPPTVMVPVGVLKHPGNEGSLPREQRRVWFADGILPNGEVADSSNMPAASPAPVGTLTVSQDTGKPSAANVSEAGHAPSAQGPGAQLGSPVGSSINLIPRDGLPPILISTGVKGGTRSQLTDYAVEERPSEILMMQQLEEGGPDPLVFVLNANLLAMVKLVNYVNRKCWCVTTKGMHAVGQAEVVVLLQCLPDEKSIPKDIFSHFVQLYQEALTGNVVTNLGHSFFTQSFLGSKEHGGFLYISPTFQSLQDLLLPNPPYLFGILVQKWETPWAKVFPLRLMLRLGAEYRFYPCPLFSVRFRKPLFGETGHTIMNLLADFRNYQYTLPMVTGLVVDMEVRKTSIKIPSNRYNELMKAMNKSNEHVLAVGACLNERADSHLVCVQNDDGNYQTQAISIHNQPRKVTGACFFVFSGALKASSGYLAKSSIVEDGVMVQITAETMEALRQALREMKDFTIACGKANQEDSQEHVHIQWLEDDRNFNKGVISPIDGKSMESITSIKIFHGSEYKANGKVIRWTEVFFLQSDDQPNGLSDPAEHSRLTENVARAFCVALCPHLKLLKEDGMAKLGLRVTLDSDQVGYLAGSNGQPLLPQYMKDLDSSLVPVIHGGACQLSEGPVVMELVFYILENLS
ncbi:zinc finger FYVE domain-containing protein 9 isoform X1 [Megalops cyprinoides]|uniref:zinc finger FYVE domain-containing protein 9 isoform X1 n=1 Tax=Megalops cyprinoides TaxID=118141 RepID=UPI001863FC65|nr:zinc finger FYVE domain-containing protein 9 isoform X1 [Megalops cyprinoides]XP_036410233.1 zinc finger FYVE domain-containing protein 9 isoform X1 [Megalops cyprinoides]